MVTKGEFVSKAPSLKITITDEKTGTVVGSFTASPRSFETGSVGWYANGKPVVAVDGSNLTVQAGMNFTIPGSKECGATEILTGKKKK
jgi:hypothetical protein